MNYKEYAMMRTFEKVFADLGKVEEYGFNTWLELFEHICENNLDELVKVDGEETYLVEDYRGGFLPDLLEYENEYILYVVAGVKEFNVTF